MGIDHSAEMAGRCRDRLREAGLSEERASVEVGDISDCQLNETFDLIVAPFRVIQNVETDAQVRGLFETIRKHLAVGGRCILNTFRPNAPRDELVSRWSTRHELEDWSVPTEDGKVVCVSRRAGVQADPLVLYPELVYRTYQADEIVEETVLYIAMRCYYPDELLERVRAEGFTVTGQWGGYAGEAYGQGPELVVEFDSASSPSLPPSEA